MESDRPAISVYSLPPCGGGLGRGVVHVCSAGAAIATPTPSPSPQGQGNRMWPVFGERAQHRNRNRVVRATLESSRALAPTIRIQNFHMRLPCPCGEGLGVGVAFAARALRK